MEKEKLTDIASRLKEGNIDALYELRKKVVDIELPELYNSKLDQRTLLVLYISKKILADVWRNLATDTEFDFPEKNLRSFSMQFGSFINTAMNKDSEGRALECLTKCIDEYYTILAEVDKQL